MFRKKTFLQKLYVGQTITIQFDDKEVRDTVTEITQDSFTLENYGTFTR